jgi:hypothetical protein
MPCCGKAGRPKRGSLAWTAMDAHRTAEGGAYTAKRRAISPLSLCAPADTEKYAAFLKRIYAEPITDLLAANAAVSIWFKQMREAWRRGLTAHYSDRGP